MTDLLNGMKFSWKVCFHSGPQNTPFLAKTKDTSTCSHKTTSVPCPKSVQYSPVLHI